MTADDVAIVQWALYTAVTWDNNPDVPPIEIAVQHPQLMMYHDGWGRPGDIGAVAEISGELAGAAFARLFTDATHGHGFVDQQTPELGIAVMPDQRGKGVGRSLMRGLEDAARESGIERLSLSVNNPNPAKRLYESLGYELVADDGESSTMVLQL